MPNSDTQLHTNIVGCSLKWPNNRVPARITCEYIHNVRVNSRGTIVLNRCFVLKGVGSYFGATVGDFVFTSLRFHCMHTCYSVYDHECVSVCTARVGI